MCSHNIVSLSDWLFFKLEQKCVVMEVGLSSPPLTWFDLVELFKIKLYYCYYYYYFTSVLRCKHDGNQCLSKSKVCVLLHLSTSQTSFCPPENIHLQPLPVCPPPSPPAPLQSYGVSLLSEGFLRCLLFSCSGVRGWFTHFLHSCRFMHPACSSLTRSFSTICPRPGLLTALVLVYHLSIRQLVISSLCHCVHHVCFVLCLLFAA